MTNEVLAKATNGRPWSAKILHQELMSDGVQLSLRTVHRTLRDQISGLISDISDVSNSDKELLNPLLVDALKSWTYAKRKPIEILQLVTLGEATCIALINGQGRLIWQAVDMRDSASILSAIKRLCELQGGSFSVLPHGSVGKSLNRVRLPSHIVNLSSLLPPERFEQSKPNPRPSLDKKSTYLDSLEQESIRIIREAFAVAKNPAMLFSMGKDSMVMLTLARKAFAPGPVPFPLVVIDTRWKFRDMYRFRAALEDDPELDLVIHINPEAIERNVNPFDFGSATHTDITKTQALRQVLDAHAFDFVFGGARRDEEKSRAKERIFSVRSSSHGWDPKNQRPELWELYNTTLVSGQTMRVFPISNWTELDIWRYLEREQVDLVPLYFSALRAYVRRNDSLIMVDDERFPLAPDEEIHFGNIRFRTLGCYPLTGGVESNASNIAEIIQELEATKVSERSSRVIDFDQGASMEQKKKDGYF
jgi:sulfate adenylyltransferase subunit 2